MLVQYRWSYGLSTCEQYFLQRYINFFNYNCFFVTFISFRVTSFPLQSSDNWELGIEIE